MALLHLDDKLVFKLGARMLYGKLCVGMVYDLIIKLKIRVNLIKIVLNSIWSMMYLAACLPET